MRKRSTLREPLRRDAVGQLAEECLGNGTTSARTYVLETGRMVGYFLVDKTVGWDWTGIGTPSQPAVQPGSARGPVINIRDTYEP